MMSEGKNILVVDDEQVIRDGCQRILSKRGCEVVQARDGQEGLECLKKDHFDIMLLDLKMPGLTGSEVLEKSKQIDPDLLVIIITGYATVESAVEAMKIGAYDFISKPFNPDQLTIVVNRALEKKRLEKETERLRLEREKSLQDVATEKSKIRTIVNCMADGVIVTDRESRIVLNNPAAARMLGLRDALLVGKPLSECIQDEELGRIIGEICACTYSEPSILSREFVVGESTVTHLRAHSCPVTSDEGDILGSVIVLEDISYLKELDRMKSNFVAMVSHELRAPLAAIEQQLMVMRDGFAGEVSEKQRHIIGRIKKRSDGLMTMIRNLLDLSKIETGQIMQQKELVNMNDLLRGVLDLFSSQAAGKKITLRFEEAREAPLIEADRSNMEVVFNNLVSNGIHYTPEGGSIGLETTVEEDFIKVEVSDTGVGIDSEDLHKVFDRFFRVRSEETRHVVGAGLGLAITKAIVEAHLGCIEVKSEIGKGTTFSVLLPKQSQCTVA
jgi:PAS domain S-box-containing protein